MRMLEETFNFGLQRPGAARELGSFLASEPTRPHYLSVPVLEPTSSFQTRSEIFQSIGKVGWRDPGSQSKAHISAVMALVSASG